MRRLVAVVAVVIALIAACSSGATTAPSVSPAPSLALSTLGPTPSPVPTSTLGNLAVEVDALVGMDGLTLVGFVDGDVHQVPPSLGPTPITGPRFAVDDWTMGIPAGNHTLMVAAGTADCWLTGPCYSGTSVTVRGAKYACYFSFDLNANEDIRIVLEGLPQRDMGTVPCPIKSVTHPAS